MPGDKWSLRQVGARDQAKGQSFLALIGSIGTASGVAFYSRVLHSATAQGDDKALPMNVRALVFVCLRCLDDCRRLLPAQISASGFLMAAVIAACMHSQVNGRSAA